MGDSHAVYLMNFSVKNKIKHKPTSLGKFMYSIDFL